MARELGMWGVVALISLVWMVGCSSSGGSQDLTSDSIVKDDGTAGSGDIVAGDLGSEDAVEPGDSVEPMDSKEPGDMADEAIGEDVFADVEPDIPWVPPFDPTVCGSEPHQWLPPDGMGAVVLSQEEIFSNVSPETIDGFLAEAGYTKFGKAKYGARNFKIRYVTQDRGELKEATAVLGIPTGDDVPWPAPMLLWLHGSTGLMDDCAPSRDMFMGSGIASLWAGQGYVTVAPDYMDMLGFGEKSPPGTIHSYLVGEATAISCLDAVRAALDYLAQNPDFGSADPERAVMIGGSQGGHAAFFAELYWPHYAPELNFLGVAAAVPLVNLAGQATYAMTELVNGSGNLMTSMVAMKNWYGNPEDLFGLLTNQEPYFAAENMEGWLSGSCSPDVDPTDVDELSDVFLEPIIEAAASGDWDSIPPWGCFLRENSVPGSSVERLSDIPFLTSYSGEDELLMTSIEQEVWPTLCEMGYTLEYKECAGLGHSQGALAILPYARLWLEDRVAGKPLAAGSTCILEPPVDCEALVVGE
jgi:dienelactone hydrolase